MVIFAQLDELYWSREAEAWFPTSPVKLGVHVLVIAVLVTPAAVACMRHVYTCTGLCCQETRSHCCPASTRLMLSLSLLCLLFSAARSGRFFLYETTTWSLRSWDTPPGAAVTAAAWAPDSSVVLLAMSGSNYLIALHLVGEPPQLVEQLLPITLPGVSDIQLE